MISCAIMAHEARKEMVDELLDSLGRSTIVEVVWDRFNNEWDTASRALEAFDPEAEWHVVIQDDAVLCDDFRQGLAVALAGAKQAGHHGPVSFYVGKSRPYAREVERLVRITEERNLPWFATRNGPYWGVCVAFPTDMLPDLIETCDDSAIDNYDSILSAYFKERKIETWYSMPSLVNHRDTAENPSLIPGHGSSSGRVAHRWIGRGSPLSIDWNKDAYHAGDQAEFWDREFKCTRCDEESSSLADAIRHAQEHSLGQVDFFATTDYHAEMLWELREKLPQELRGALWVAGMDVAKECNVPYHFAIRRHSAPSHFGRAGNYVICGAFRDFRWIHSRAGWSLDGKSN